MTEEFRAGFVAVVGRPNTGKSTLTNALVGQKVAITSSRPETTRKVIRGIVQRDTCQLILVDTPGLHRPRTLLGERLNDLVRDSLADVDAVALCLPANEKSGPGDRVLLERVAHIPTVIAVITKTDTVTREQLANRIIEVDQLHPFAAIVPVGALTDDNLDELVSVLASYMPESPALYPKDMTSEESDEDLIAELIREAALEGVRDELPHSIAVVVEEMREREPAASSARNDAEAGEGRARRKPVLEIMAEIYVERSSQKGIVIGKGGARLRDVGIKARKEIEKLLGRRVYLDLHVRVSKEWQRDPKKLQRLGF